MELEPLFEITAEVAPPIVISDTPDGTRVIVHITGGKFEGARLKGTLLASGGDWFLMRADGVGVIDVRLALQTDDGENIYMTYTGRGRMGATGLTGISTAPTFAASTKGKYAWLNSVQAFAEGETTLTGVKYKLYVRK
ncbi:MAG: DUF3237 domain-containing protein [Candidatus Binatus sp.]|jgi:hypothetical protein|uniref:DUF3237 domain-containing protein n=1 Tax=Candidatus Binatus sp. TaxID=2811406 RepID=UPI003C70D970